MAIFPTKWSEQKAARRWGWWVPTTRWWQLKYVLFSPRKFGEDEPKFDVYIFQLGWLQPPTKTRYFFEDWSHHLNYPPWKPNIFAPEFLGHPDHPNHPNLQVRTVSVFWGLKMSHVTFVAEDWVIFLSCRGVETFETAYRLACCLCGWKDADVISGCRKPRKNMGVIIGPEIDGVPWWLISPYRWYMWYLW